MKKWHSAALTLLLAMHLSVAIVWAEDAGRLEPYVVSSFGEAQDIDALLAANNRFVNGFTHRSKEEIAAVLAPDTDFKYIAGDGGHLDKTTYIEKFWNVLETNKVTDFKNGRLFLQVFGDMAVVSGQNEYDAVLDGKPVTTKGRYVDVYHKYPQDGWKVVHANLFRLSTTPKP